MTEDKLPPNGFAWHMYHDHLISFCWDYERRCRVIEYAKPAHEIVERLKRFQFIKGELPKAFRGVKDNSHITELVEEHWEVIEALHKKECPNCSWDGCQLVFRCRRLQRAWYRIWKWYKDKYYGKTKI